MRPTARWRPPAAGYFWGPAPARAGGCSVFSVTYKGVTVEVKRGDITEEDEDAIVNPANSLMIMGGGVAGAIKRKGGKVIEDEARSRAPVPVGKAIATTAGSLKARYVIHSPTMEYPAMATTVDKVRAATRAALELASQMGLRSIAFPGMGTGVGGLGYSEAARAMVGEIKSFIDSGRSSLTKIVLVAFDEGLYASFEEAVKELLR